MSNKAEPVTGTDLREPGNLLSMEPLFTAPTGSSILSRSPLALMRISSVLAFSVIVPLGTGLANEPAKALEDYFKAIRTHDADLLSKAIQAPAAYKDQFIRVIEVAKRLQHLDNLLLTKYEVAPDKRHDFSRYLGALSSDIKGTKIEIRGDRAQSLPSKPNEAPVFFVQVSGDWKLDLEKGQSDVSLAKQAEHLKKVNDSVIPLLNGLIQKIDSLDTNKFTYEQAWRMVAIQMERKIQSVTGKHGEPDGAPNGAPPRR